MLARSRTCAALCLVAMTISCVGCGGGSGLETPETCFQTIRVAAHNQDIRTVYQSLTDESQDVIVGGLVAFAAGAKFKSSFAPNDAELKRQSEAYAAVLEKHGMSDEAVLAMFPRLATISGPEDLPAFAGDVDDKAAFMADMYAAMQETGEVNFGKEFYEQLAGELKQVTIDGDEAAAVVVTESGEQALEFHKTPAGWKLHINLRSIPPQAGGASVPALGGV